MSSSYYECEVWQIDVEDDEDDRNYLMEAEGYSSICPVFTIEIFANVASDEPTIVEQILVPQEQLTQSSCSTSWSAISSKLSQMNVPFSLHATVTQKIIDCARSAMNETRNKNRKNIPIIVALCPIRLIIEEEELLGEYSLDLPQVSSRGKGARKGAMEALEKVEVEEGFRGQCVICLEEIWDGMKASKTPCSHVYHQDCIVSWLEKSKLCPLCRFQMPI